MESTLSGANRFRKICNICSTPPKLPTTSLPIVRRTLRATSAMCSNKLEAFLSGSNGEIFFQIYTFSSGFRKELCCPSKVGATIWRESDVFYNQRFTRKRNKTATRSTKTGPNPNPSSSLLKPKTCPRATAATSVKMSAENCRLSIPPSL